MAAMDESLGLCGLSFDGDDACSSADGGPDAAGGDAGGATLLLSALGDLALVVVVLLPVMGIHRGDMDDDDPLGGCCPSSVLVVGALRFARGMARRLLLSSSRSDCSSSSSAIRNSACSCFPRSVARTTSGDKGEEDDGEGFVMIAVCRMSNRIGSCSCGGSTRKGRRLRLVD